jgi:hypothetical protein
MSETTDTRTRRTGAPAKKTRTAKTPDERAAEVEALTAQLAEAVMELTTSEAWVRMLRVAAKFTRYSPTNVLLLWMQAKQRGVTLSRVAAKSVVWPVRGGVGREVARCDDGAGDLSRSSSWLRGSRQRRGWLPDSARSTAAGRIASTNG